MNGFNFPMLRKRDVHVFPFSFLRFYAFHLMVMLFAISALCSTEILFEEKIIEGKQDEENDAMKIN